MIELLNIEPCPAKRLCMHMVLKLFEGRVQLKPDNQCGNNSRVGRIQGNTVIAVFAGIMKKFTGIMG